jgi:hypothetical protein
MGAIPFARRVILGVVAVGIYAAAQPAGTAEPAD